MTEKIKGRAGWHQATLKSSEISAKSTRLTSGFKAMVVTLALWGVLPVPAAEWIIRRGGLRDV